jgi:hypothetical protein
VEREKQLSSKLIIFIVGFFITWLPYTVRSLTTMFTTFSFGVEFKVFSGLCAKTSLIWTPIFFIYANKKVQKILTSNRSEPYDSVATDLTAMKILKNKLPRKGVQI